MARDRNCVYLCRYIDLIVGWDPAVMLLRPAASECLRDTVQQQGDKRHFNDLLGCQVTSCLTTYLPPMGYKWSLTNEWWLSWQRRASLLRAKFIFSVWKAIFIISRFLTHIPLHSFRHSFSMLNILRGKTNSANLSERSPLLRFSQDDRWVNP